MRDGGALALRQVGRGIGHVHLDPLDQRAEGRDRDALTAFGHLRQHVGRELEVPGIVEFARLHHRATCGVGVAAALEVHVGEGRFGRVAVVGVRLERDHVVRAEIGHHEGAGSDGGEVLFGAGGCGRAEYSSRTARLLQDRRLAAHERAVGVGGGGAEGDLDGERVDHLDQLDAAELGQLRAAAIGVHAVLAGELHILGRHIRAVGPLQAFLQLPGDRGQVLGHAAVLDRGNFLGKVGHERAGRIVAAQRLEHEARGLDVLGASRKVGRHDRRCLPVDDVDGPVLSAFGHGGRSEDKRGRGPQQQGSELHSIAPHWASGLPGPLCLERGMFASGSRGVDRNATARPGSYPRTVLPSKQTFRKMQGSDMASGAVAFDTASTLHLALGTAEGFIGNPADKGLSCWTMPLRGSRICASYSRPGTARSSASRMCPSRSGPARRSAWSASPGRASRCRRCR